MNIGYKFILSKKGSDKMRKYIIRNTAFIKPDNKISKLLVNISRTGILDSTIDDIKK